MPEHIEAEVREWLEANWQPARPLREWLVMVVDAGWAVPSWPEDHYGRSLTPADSQAIVREFARFAAPGAGQDLFNIPGNTLLRHGSPGLRRAFLRAVLTTEVEWCLLYSEPGAGSDLAAVQTRADRYGDGWVINGQKVWTTGAGRADYGLLLARTTWDVPKHHGLTMFWFPMKQAGVEIRPIRQITGGSQFSEVFFTDACAANDAVLGAAGDGWRVVRSALAYERALMAGSRSAAGMGTAQRGDEPDDLGAAVTLDSRVLAERMGKGRDAVLRQEIARLHALRLVNRWNRQRGAGMLGKLAASQLAHATARLNARILGAETMLVGGEFPQADAVNHAGLAAYQLSIGGGTDQIQRNLIAEVALGLPREPELDRDVPFSEVRKARAVRPYG